jgi:hypothetical protein
MLMAFLSFKSMGAPTNFTMYDMRSELALANWQITTTTPLNIRSSDWAKDLGAVLLPSAR